MFAICCMPHAVYVETALRVFVCTEPSFFCISPGSKVSLSWLDPIVWPPFSSQDIGIKEGVSETDLLPQCMGHTNFRFVSY